MKVYPHILLRRGDIIRVPWGDVHHVVIVLELIEWKLLVECYNNRFILPRGFYLKCKWYFVPLEMNNGSYFNLGDETT